MLGLELIHVNKMGCKMHDIDGLMQACNYSIADAKSLIYTFQVLALYEYGTHIWYKAIKNTVLITKWHILLWNISGYRWF